MASSSTRLARASRWGLLGAVILIGAALVATVWTTYRGVSSASNTLVRGQATLFFGVLHSAVREHRRVPTAAELEAVIDEHRAEGLRYIAFFGPDGRVAVEAGDPPPDRDRLDARTLRRGRRPERVGDRIRIVSGRRRRRAPTAILEFVPSVADALRANAALALAAGGLVGVILLALALVLIRWYLRQAELERQLAHERRLAALGEMSAVLAHEIRNPIASLKGNAQLLVKMLDGAEDKPKKKAERLVAESTRLETLTNDLLEFARAGSIERTRLDPGALLGEAAAGHGDQVELDTSAAPASWSLDGPRLRQVLANLIENACQASSEPIEARVSSERGRLVFEVLDRGPGIGEGDAGHIFEPFFTTKTRGTGLGLAVARRLVELHGGAISAANRPGGGAAFRVEIPEDRS